MTIILSTVCDRCGCSYALTLKPPGSLCEDLSGALDRWPLSAPTPTDEDLHEDQCVGICQFHLTAHDACTGTFHDVPVDTLA